MKWLWCFWWKVFCWQNGSEEKMHFLNTTVLTLWQNIFHPQMFWLSCQLFSISAIKQSFCCRLKDFFSSSSVEATGGITNTTTIHHIESLVPMLWLVQYSSSAKWAKGRSWAWVRAFSAFLSFIYAQYLLKYSFFFPWKKILWELSFI